MRADLQWTWKPTCSISTTQKSEDGYRRGRKFPDALIVPITYHHNLVGGEGENLNFALMVHLANILTKKNDIGLNHELEIPEPSDMVEEVLGLDEQKVNSISEEISNAKSYIQEFFRYLKE